MHVHALHLQAVRVARINCYALMGSAHGPLSIGGPAAPSGIELLVDLLATAHEEKSADAVAMASAGARAGAAVAAAAAAGSAKSGGAPLMLTASAHEEAPREWYWLPSASLANADANTKGACCLGFGSMQCLRGDDCHEPARCYCYDNVLHM